MSVAHLCNSTFRICYSQNERSWLPKLLKPVSGEYSNVFGIIEGKWHLVIDGYGTHEPENSHRLENTLEI